MRRAADSHRNRSIASTLKLYRFSDHAANKIKKILHLISLCSRAGEFSGASVSWTPDQTHTSGNRRLACLVDRDADMRGEARPVLPRVRSMTEVTPPLVKHRTLRNANSIASRFFV